MGNLSHCMWPFVHCVRPANKLLAFLSECWYYLYIGKATLSMKYKPLGETT